MTRARKVIVVFGCAVVAVVLCRHRHPDPPQAATKYIGKTLDQVVADLGQPLRTHSFTLGQPLDEMRAPLRNRFPLSTPGNANIEIREGVWQDSDYYITVWFHKLEARWVAIEGLRWHKDVRF